jgi:cobalt-precorrin 5A hydrolase / cobalt-factor III methyltransferase / precorrin-3B C17-methyltransferase
VTADLVIGVGARRGVGVDDLADLIDRTLAEAGLHLERVRCLATVDNKAGEAGIRAVAASRGWPVQAFPAEALCDVPVPNPAEAVRTAVGTPSVAEAAALLAAGRGAALVVPKRTGATATVAVAAAPRP